MKWLQNHATIDFETRSALDVRQVGPRVYARHPSTQIMFLSFALPWFRPNEVVTWNRKFDVAGINESPAELLEPLFEFIRNGGAIEAHNAQFEEWIWREIGVKQHGWPKIKNKQWRDSAAKAAAMALPRNLGELGEALNLPVTKDASGQALINKYSKPRKLKKAEREWFGDELVFNEDVEGLLEFGKYNAQDVRAERRVSMTIPELSPVELRIWQITQDMNRRGVAIDLDLCRAALELTATAKAKLNAELHKLTGIEKGSQREALKAWLEENENLILFDSTAKTLEWYLERFDPHKTKLSPRARRVLEIMREVNRTSPNKYKKMLQLQEGGRIYDLLAYCGAERTGRWAGKGIQVQNLPKGNLPKGYDMDTACADIKTRDFVHCSLIYGDVMNLIVSCLRGAIIAPKGRELIVADYSAIEARCVLWLAGATNALKVFTGETPAVQDVSITLTAEDLREVKREADKAAMNQQERDGGRAESDKFHGYCGEKSYAKLTGRKWVPGFGPDVGKTFYVRTPVKKQRDTQSRRYWFQAEGANQSSEVNDAGQPIDRHTGKRIKGVGVLMTADFVGPANPNMKSATFIAKGWFNLSEFNAFEHADLEEHEFGRPAYYVKRDFMKKDFSKHLKPTSDFMPKTVEGDIYLDMASGIFGRKITRANLKPITSDGKTERDFGKVAVLGLGYGMGWIKFLLTLRDYKIFLTRDEVKAMMGLEKLRDFERQVNKRLWPVLSDFETERRFKAAERESKVQLRRLTDEREDPKAIIHELALCLYTVGIYRDRYEQVPDMWKEQEAAAIEAIRTKDPIVCKRVTWLMKGRYLLCRLPSGRCLHYCDPELVKAKTAWGEERFSIRYMGRHQKTKKWSRLSTYGGKLVENITQATARDIMALAMVGLDDAPTYDLVMTIHDEAVAEVEEGKSVPKEFERIMREMPQAFVDAKKFDGCPITAESKIFKRYRKG